MVEFSKIFKDLEPEKKAKRIGRGIGSGKGKTAGRGHKGQKSRSGVAIKGFEGGQMPIHRRLPKRGFNNNFSEDIYVINLQDIQYLIDKKRIESGKVISLEYLKSINYIKKNINTVKLLSKGDLKAKIEVDFGLISKVAKEKIIKAGGKIKE